MLPDDRGKMKYLEKNVCQHYFVQHKFHVDWPGTPKRATSAMQSQNTGMRWDREMSEYFSVQCSPTAETVLLCPKVPELRLLVHTVTEVFRSR
jgi:hypothetical protein